MTTSTAAAADRLYALVANEEDARLCTDIPDAACREVPGNFFRILASLVMTNVGDMLASPKVVLAWLLGAVGVPAALVSWLIPDSSWLGWVVIPACFVLSIAHAGVRIGRKTFFVDVTGGNKRTDYVAVSNTAIGFALLAVGGLSGLASLVSVETALALLGAMGVAGLNFRIWQLNDAQASS